ncbi:MAG: YybH family protein [Sphingobacteriales bacterium]|jgi:hypothetical protein
MKKIIVAVLFFHAFNSFAQDKDKQIVLNILDKQTQAWNNGELDQFMVGYWNNDSLMYIGKNGVTYGYRSTLENYKKNYSNRDKMGQLKFTILHTNRLAKEIIQVVGKWYLTRTIGNVGGHFTLIFKKINGEWVIISDHSS